MIIKRYQIVISALLLTLAGRAAAGIGDGLLAHYPFDGDVLDHAGRGHDGIAYGAQPTTDRFGREDGAYLFDGVDDYVVVPDAQELRLAQGDFSLSAWIYETQRNPGNHNSIVTKRGGGVSNGWFWSISGQAQGGSEEAGIGRLFYIQSGGETTAPRIVSSETTTLFQWQLMTLVYDASARTARLYIDGRLAKEKGSFAPPTSTTTEPMLVGGDSNNIGRHDLYTRNNRFHGKIDDLRIYARALSAADIDALFRQSAPADSSVVDPADTPAEGGGDDGDGAGSDAATTGTDPASTADGNDGSTTSDVAGADEGGDASTQDDAADTTAGEEGTSQTSCTVADGETSMPADDGAGSDTPSDAGGDGVASETTCPTTSDLIVIGADGSYTLNGEQGMLETLCSPANDYGPIPLYNSDTGMLHIPRVRVIGSGPGSGRVYNVHISAPFNIEMLEDTSDQ